MTVALKPHARLAILALGLLLAPLDRAEAAGFEIYNQGARAMGFAGAYVAQAYDPSAIYFNAAGVGFLKGKNLYLSAGLGNFKTDFTGHAVGNCSRIRSLYCTTRTAILNSRLMIRAGWARSNSVPRSVCARPGAARSRRRHRTDACGWPERSCRRCGHS